MFEIDTLHLVLDGNGCDIDKLADFNAVFNFLNDLPSELGMRKMTAPYVVRWHDKGAEKEGLTGFVTIAESHLSVHTFPDNGRVYADIFSCKQFDVKKVTEIFRRAFEPSKVVNKVVRKGEGVIP